MTLALACGRARPNVLLITVDTLRADRVGCYGYAAARTPYIDSVARDGVRAVDATAAAPITLPSHASILTGLYPPTHGVRDNGSYALGDDAVTLAERLGQAGYRTHAVVSAVVLSRRYNLTQGFEVYDDDLWAEDEPRLFLIRDRPGPQSAARAARWLDSWSRETPRRPFFLWLHVFDPHQPYRTVGPGLSGTYDTEVTQADRAVGILLEALRRLQVEENTLVVLTADHGESLGEHGEKTHAVFVYDATTRVPLLWRWPGRLPAGSAYLGPVRSVDIAPTLLAAIDLGGGAETQGQDLLAALRGDEPPPDLAQYSESLVSEVGFGMAPLHALRHGGHKWIRAPRPELYDLRVDPGEVSNLMPVEARLGAQLDRQLEAVLVDSRHRALAPQKSPMDRETEENLRALGYLASGAERRDMGGMDPKDGMVLYAKLEDARHLARAERWNEAERLLRQILAVTPRNVSAINVLALCRQRRGDAAGARSLYRQALALDPKQARVHNMLANMALNDGDWDEAQRGFERTLEVSPTFVEAMSGLGMIAALRGDEAGAERWYRRAVAADPGFPWVYRRLADLEYERGEFARALAHYEKVLQVVRDDFVSLIQAGNSARRIGDRETAFGYFARAAELRPDSWIPLYNWACLQAVGGDARGALETLRQAIARGFGRTDLLREDEDLASVRKLAGFGDLLDRARAKTTQEPAASAARLEGSENG